MKISYAITVCNEFLEIQKLVPFLLENKRQQDEIVVLVDLSKNTPTSELLGYLHKLSSNNRITLVEDKFNNHFANWKNRLTRACKGDYIFQIDADELHYLLKFNKLPNVQTWRGFEFENNFAQWKNLLNTYCAGDYIFQIDADELPNDILIQNLPSILEANPTTDVYYVPRVNTVEGLTESHIKKWGWRVDDKGWVNFPDYQMRIYKNKSDIKWKNKVHEVIEGYESFAALPAQEELSLYHPKDIERQEKQNNYYDTL